MAPFCLRCGAPVGDDDMRCTGCGADLDPCGTVPPPGPVGRASAKDAQPARAVRKRRLEPAASEDSRPARPARPGKRSKPKPTPPPQPAYPQPRLVRPAYPVPSPSLPPPVRPNEPVPTSPGFYHQAAPDPGRLAVPPPPPGANPQQGGPGVFRGLLIKMLGAMSTPRSPPRILISWRWHLRVTHNPIRLRGTHRRHTPTDTGPPDRPRNRAVQSPRRSTPRVDPLLPSTPRMTGRTGPRLSVV
jgi:hypothetical protein